MVIRLSWEGRERKFFYDKAGKPFTYAEALNSLGDINKEIRERTFDPSEWEKAAIMARKFEAAWETFLEKKAKLEARGERSPSTLAVLKGFRRNHFIYFEGRDVRDIRLKHLETFYEELPEHLSPKTKKNMMDALKSFFRYLERRGDIDTMPIWPEIGEIIQKEGFALQVDEQMEVLKKIPTEHRDIIEFLMETGLRPGEGCALMEIDINYRTRYALIRRTWTRDRLRQRNKEKREKWKPLSDRACELLEANQGRSDFCFTNPVTKRGYRPAFVRRLWKKYAGVDMRLYDGTRHSWFSQMVEAGATETELMKAGGHSDVKTLQRYFHPSQSRQHDLVNRRGNVINLQDAKDKL
jgi:integrase